MFGINYSDAEKAFTSFVFSAYFICPRIKVFFLNIFRIEVLKVVWLYPKEKMELLYFSDLRFKNEHKPTKRKNFGIFIQIRVV